jgi:hypothetical protein
MIPRFSAMVVLPTPPFREATDRITVIDSHLAIRETA